MNRRDFMKTTAAAAVATQVPLPPALHRPIMRRIPVYDLDPWAGVPAATLTRQGVLDAIVEMGRALDECSSHANWIPME